MNKQMYLRDDPDQQNLIDSIQEGWLQCCGIEGPWVRYCLAVGPLTTLAL